MRANDPHCRGILVLGQNVADTQLAQAFDAAAQEPLVRGFAVGRTIFWLVAEAWFAGRIDDREAVNLIAINYLRVAQLWRTPQQA